ncbi:sensor histidine kinase [Ruania zhangjianzhongii]|uniref:sensor histidine kinase n=1 Tax=Ruania zhangjianzhongii TaxID=2603206 RepID=UPI001F2D1257|nr:sensor histidine kinase [Ruania zhangjianzhongii]
MTQPATPPRTGSSWARPFTVDAIIAAILVFTLGMLSVAIGIASSSAVGGIVAALTGLGMPAALAWRRTRPVASSVAVYAMALAHVLAGVILTGSDVVIFIALYSVTVYGPVWARRTALFSGIFGCLIIGGWLFFARGEVTTSAVVASLSVAGLLSAFVLGTWAIALMRRARVVQIETLAERAARLEVERDQQAQIATAAERARIAREMHDIVAHSLSVIIAQADGGRYAAATSPEAATHALTTISETGRDALADMRRILGVLRSDGRGDAALTPQPAQADLDTLVAHVRDTGLAVSLVRMGTARALPPGAGLTIYRIAQESLTNILKHAGPGAGATVLLQWTPASLVLQIDDDGRGAAASSDGAGQGLLGMRERATMLGGTLATGPRPGGGYRVHAEIPVPAGAPVVGHPGQSEPAGVPRGAPTGRPWPPPQAPQQALPIRPPNTVGPGRPPTAPLTSGHPAPAEWQTGAGQPYPASPDHEDHSRR